MGIALFWCVFAICRWDSSDSKLERNTGYARKQIAIICKYSTACRVVASLDTPCGTDRINDCVFKHSQYLAFNCLAWSWDRNFHSDICCGATKASKRYRDFCAEPDCILVGIAFDSVSYSDPFRCQLSHRLIRPEWPGVSWLGGGPRMVVSGLVYRTCGRDTAGFKPRGRGEADNLTMHPSQFVFPWDALGADRFSASFFNSRGGRATRNCRPRRARVSGRP